MHRFTKLLALGALFIPAAVLAQETRHRFTQDGVTYDYTLKTGERGRQVIGGRRLDNGSAFYLVVRGDRVDGISGGRPVSFRVPPAGGVTVAAR